MASEADKAQRSILLLKGLMALVVINQAVQFYQTNTLDFGSIATAIGLLCLLRGLLLSPHMFSTPLKRWFKRHVGFKGESIKYFFAAFVFLVVGNF